MKKVLFFSPYFFPYTSGITTYPLHLFQQLQKDFSITVLTFPHEKGLAEKEKLDTITIKRMSYLFKITKGYISPQSFMHFWNYVKKSDMVILNIPNVEGLPLAILAKLMKKPVIAIYHCEIHPTTSLLSRLLSGIVKLAVNGQLTLATRIVGYTQEYLEKTGVAQKYGEKVQVVLPPIPKVQVDEKTLADFKKEKGKKIWIGYAGRIAREKGIEYLIEALKKTQLNPENVELHFAGPFGKQVAGEESYYNEILEMLIESGFSYTFHGNLSGPKLGAFYKILDVMVLPSVNSTEAFGMVQAEAMSVGTPVIASDLPGVRVPIHLTNMGIVVKPQNTNHLSTAIQLIIKKKGNYSNPTTLKSAHKLFSMTNTVQFYKKLIHELL